jgi:RHS repeat-associated protein
VSFPGADPHKVPIDPSGNLTSKTEGTDVWGYEWNAENQLKRVLLNGNEVARFAYDPRGRRVEKVAGGVTTSYLYDGEDILREIKGPATFRYVHGPGTDEPLAREQGSGALTYYHADGLGSVMKRTSQAGAIVHEYRYDAWGNIESGASEPGHAFTSREWDADVGLAYYRARYYDPSAGLFISEDPAGFPGAAGAYTYVTGNPTSWRDPSGLWRVDPKKRAKPDENTIVCHGNRVVIQIRQDPIREACGLSGCTRGHEQRHVDQVLASNPRICVGMPDGARPMYSSFDEERTMEREASCLVSVPCLRKLLDKARCPAGCEDLVRAELDVMESECERHGGNPSK